MNTLQTALEAIELLTTDNASEQAQAAAADARIKIANAMTQVDFIAVPRDGTEPLMGLSLSEQEDEQTVEPVAWMRTNNHGGGVLSHSLHSEKPKNPPFPALAWITPLYLHQAPQPQLRECWYESDELKVCRKCGQLHDKAITPPQQVAVTNGECCDSPRLCRINGECAGKYGTKATCLTPATGERAELIAKLKGHDEWVDTLTRGKSLMLKAADMLEADAQPPAPTGWDNGLSQDYCKELGQWLASRPGARQQVKEMFEADAQQAKQVPMTPKEIQDWWASESKLEDCDMCKLHDFETVVRAVEKRCGIGGEA